MRWRGPCCSEVPSNMWGTITMLTQLSLRLATQRIVQVACGAPCEQVVVVSPRLFEPKMYLIQVAAEVRSDFHLHIAHNTDVPLMLGCDALYLTETEATRLQEYAEKLPDLRFDHG